MNNLQQKILIALFLFSSWQNAWATKADKTSEYDPPAVEVVKRLDWVSDDKAVCRGSFQDPLADFSGTVLPDISHTPVAIDADQVIFNRNSASALKGNVTITQPGRSLNADKININRNAAGDISTADLVGHVVLREPNKLAIGNSAHVELTTRAGTFYEVLYRFLIGSANPATNTAFSIPLNAWGKADSFSLDPAGLVELKKTTYTTCAPTANTWKISAKKIDLDRDEGQGVAHDAWLSLQGVPVFYVPYLSFPIDDRRKSGFLFPGLSNSTLSGLTLATPYYWNIATNYDAIITPVMYGKRGVQINGLFRYLTTHSYGQVNVGYLPNDRAFAEFKRTAAINYSTVTTPALHELLTSSNNRGLFAWQDKHQFGSRWTTNIDYNYVTDDYYFQNFTGLNLITQNQLPQHASADYVGNTWNFKAKVLSYQTLHPINQAATANPYQALPQLDLNGSFPNQAYGLNYQLNNQLVYFQRERNPGEVVAPVDAMRLNIQPSVNLPLNWSAGYVRPTLQLFATSYRFGHQVGNYPSSIQRTLPLFSMDSGLYFDRQLNWNGANYQQTLEPRLFYLYVPYKNQNDIPIFDSSLIPFSYDTLFLTNRFSGQDRIGDANQMTFALTTRLLNEIGSEKLRASIGQIYYFRNREVNLCSPIDIANAPSGSVCANPNSLVGATSSTERISPIAGQLSYDLGANWRSNANVAWDIKTKEAVSGNLNFQYKPSYNRIFNINYNYLRFGDIITTNIISPPPANSHRNDLNQGGFSFGWPLGERWAVIGAWNYNFGRNYTQTYFYGLEYDNCCWSVRLVSGKTFNSLNQNGNPVFNNAVYLQWQLKGLGTVSSGDPSSLLLNNIAGYQDNFRALNAAPSI